MATIEVLNDGQKSIHTASLNRIKVKDEYSISHDSGPPPPPNGALNDIDNAVHLSN